MHLILASTSPYRKELLSRLRLPFEQIAPDFNEAQAGSMPAKALVKFNTLGKAKSILKQRPEAMVIASDQIAICGNTILGKPGDIETACKQLRLLSGQAVTFLTGLTLLSESSAQFDMIPFQVCFRALKNTEIRTYVETEQPLDCTGSFKSEGLSLPFTHKSRHRTLAHGSDQGAVRR